MRVRSIQYNKWVDKLTIVAFGNDLSPWNNHTITRTEWENQGGE